MQLPSCADASANCYRHAIVAWVFACLSCGSLAHASDTFGGGTIIVPTTASGGAGAVADLQSDNDTRYTVAKSGSISIGGFGSYGGTINSVYLFAQYSTESGYTGTNAIQVNGVNTTIIPAARDYGRWGYAEITGGSFGIDTTAEIESLTVTFTNNDGGAGDAVLFDCIYVVVNPTSSIPNHPTWLEDFNGTGQADPLVWVYEEGYQRNNELQYYVVGADNGWQEDGNFIIEARKDTANDYPGYDYTSASIYTHNKFYWQYGRAQIRAKIPAKSGMWPAIWGTGENGQWPHNGEVDIMEYYGDNIKANCAVGNSTAWSAKWFSSSTSATTFFEAVDSNWRDSYHIWTMQWDDQNVRLYIDNVLLKTVPQSQLKNATGYNASWGPEYPFTQGFACWLNLAMGGAGGNPQATMNTGPQRYLIDYWKIWEGAISNVAPTNIVLDANSVEESLPAGTVVGYLTAADADPSEVHRYTLVSGTGDTHNSQFYIPEFISDNTLAGALVTNEVLDYTEGATRSIRVRVTDLEGATYDKVFSINVLPDQSIDVSASSVEVAEGGTQTFNVKLRVMPTEDVTINVSRASGDSDIGVVLGGTLTFTSANGTTWQQVTLAAAEDGDIANGVASIQCVDPGGVWTSASLSATEVDNDNNSPVVNAGPNQTVHFASAGGGTVTSGANIYLDAGLDDGANNIWEDSTGLWDVTLSGAYTFVADAGSSLQGITSAYEFAGPLDGGGGGEGSSLETLGVDRSPITLELWFKPDASPSYSSNGQILWETGGGTGLGIFYNNGLVEVAHDSNQGQISSDVSHLTDEFIQVVVTYDTSVTANSFSLYINGEHIVTTDRDDPDMCASDAAGLGKRGGSNTGGAGTGTANAESFDGQIAIFRSYHNRILNAQEVAANYEAVVGSQVSAVLDGSVNELDSESTTLAWSVISGPAAVFANTSQLDTTVSFFAAGTYVLRLTADDGTSTPGYDDLTITVGEVSPFGVWTAGTFSGTLRNVAMGADPDGDGIANLHEFAFGLDPTSPDTASLSYVVDGDVTQAGLPVLENFAPAGETPDFRAVFVRRKDYASAGITYGVDFSAELAQWTTSTATPTVLTGSGTPSDYEVVSVPYLTTVPAHDSTENLPPRFFRVAIESN